MENKEKNHDCTTCKYFYQHYVISNTQIIQTLCGHCVNIKLMRKQRNNFNMFKGCEFWESNDVSKAEAQENIIKTLRRMEKHLNEMKQILKLDK